MTDVTPFDLVTPRSACGALAVTVSVSVALLLPGVGSLNPAGTAPVAVLLTLPAGPVTVAESVNVTEPLLGRLGMVSPASICATVGLPGHTAPAAAAQLRVVLVRPAEAGSVTVALLTASGPLLVMTIV